MKIVKKAKDTLTAWTVWAAATCYGCAPITPSTAVLAPEAVASMQYGYFLAEKADYENAFCLQGRVRGDTVYVTHSENPVVTRASAHSIFYRCRPNKGLVGTAHTHSSKYPENLPCRQSTIDSLLFKEQPLPLQIVVCRDNAVAYLK